MSMASSSSSCALFSFSPFLDHIHNNNNTRILQLPNTAHNNNYCSFLGHHLQLQLQRKRCFKGTSDCSFVVRNAFPEAAAAGDLLSSLSLPTIPANNPWGVTGIAALLVVVPFLLVPRLLTFTKEVDMVAQTVEKIADAVGKVAEQVEKAAEDIAAALPEGCLKKLVSSVEHLAEETAKDAQKVEDLMDKVEELDDKLESFLEK